MISVNAIKKELTEDACDVLLVPEASPLNQVCVKVEQDCISKVEAFQSDNGSPEIHENVSNSQFTLRYRIRRKRIE